MKESECGSRIYRTITFTSNNTNFTTSCFSHCGMRRTPDCPCHIHPLVNVIRTCFHTQRDFNTTRDYISWLRASAWPDPHRCWPAGRPARWDEPPAAPDGSSAPAATVSVLHNHSQLVCQVTVRSGCPKVVMLVVMEYEGAAVSLCPAAAAVHVEMQKNDYTGVRMIL